MTLDEAISEERRAVLSTMGTPDQREGIISSPGGIAMTRGSCLCGAVQFEIDGKTTEIGMCHCSKCRKVSGVASNATLMIGRDGLRWISGEDRLAKFEMADGWGPWRCSVCGSPVPKLHPGGGAYWVPAGLLDADPGVRIAAHIFVGSRAPWDEIAGDAPQTREGFGSEQLD